jgi:pimeloyl-ACP methyl ester carboxylesterase
MGHRYSAAMWYPLLPRLTAQHRVIWLDNRGTGESDAPRNFTVADMARDALAVMDAAGVPQAHVFGVSMGGGIALELAMQQPDCVTSLILGCTALFTADKPRAPAWILPLYYLPSGFIRALLPRTNNRGYGSAASAEAIARDEAMSAKDKRSTAGVVAQAKAVRAHSTTHAAAARLTMPTLVMHGDEDALVPFAWGEEIAATIPGARFVRFAGAGHNFIVAGGEKAGDEVLRFLVDVDASGR